MGIKSIALAASALVLTANAGAATLSITGYDITNASVNGSGGWSHTYDGTITSTGSGTANYSGGSGTLNDGITTDSSINNQLFNFPSEINPIITLYLDGFYSIESISLYNALTNGSWALNSFDIGISSSTESFFTTTTAARGSWSDLNVSLSSSTLDGLVTNQIILSNFISDSSSYDGAFNFSEIQVEGVAVSAVPVPAAVWLFGSGLLGLIGLARRGA